MNPDKFKNSWAVILAGGAGTRFWPKSLKKKPKQLWALGGGSKTMLELTLERLDPIIPPERRIIVTNITQINQTKEIAKNACKHFIPEPVGRNTAAALTLAALEVKYLSDSSNESTMLSFHADHIIQENDIFLQTLEEAVTLSEKKYLTLIGIKPKAPETAFGYIKIAENILGDSFLVEDFCEKPNKNIAKQYLKEGSYYWNSGLFVWNNSFFLEEMKKNLQKTHEDLHSFYLDNRSEKNCFESGEFEKTYHNLQNISIDHALLEKSKCIAMTASNMSWLDIGSWDSLPKAFPKDKSGNFVSADSFLWETKNCVIDSEKKFVATLGLEDIIIVTTDKAVLVCHKSKAQEVKKVVTYLKENHKENLL